MMFRIMMQDEEHRRRGGSEPRQGEVADWTAMGLVGGELGEMVSGLAGHNQAVQAIQRWLLCVAASQEAARRRIGESYVLPRQKLWWAGMVIKKWDDARWKRFFRVDKQLFWKIE